MLTEMQIRQAKGREANYSITDGDGMRLVITPSGRKYWEFRYSFGDTRKSLYAGEHPALGLKAAREKCADYRRKLRDGIDPRAEIQANVARQISAPTIAALVETFDEKHLKTKRSRAEVMRMIKREIVEARVEGLRVGDVRVAQFSGRLINAIVDQIRDRDAQRVADHVQQLCGQLIKFAHQIHVTDAPPLPVMARRERPEIRTRNLDDAEIKLLWRELSIVATEANDRAKNARLAMQPGTALALKLLLVTGQRAGEVIGMKWDEIDGDTWTVPTERSKNKRAHRVPLTPLALDILATAKVLAAQSAYVFPSPLIPATPAEAQPIGRHSLNRALDRNLLTDANPAGRLALPQFTPHDLRRTMRTNLARVGVPVAIAERVINHLPESRLLAIYDQHGYAKEKRAALLRWERKLRSIINATTDSNVVSFTASR